MSENPEFETVKWYSNARRFPTLVGKFPNSNISLPFGPYTVPQVVVFGVLLIGGYHTRDLWGPFGLMGNIATLLVVSMGAAIGLGRLPLAGRNVRSAVSAATRVTFAPAWGRRGGAAVQLRRPHRVTSRMRVLHPTVAAAPQAAAVAAPAEVAPTRPRVPALATKRATEPATGGRGAAAAVAPALAGAPQPRQGVPERPSEPATAPPRATTAGCRRGQLSGVQALLAQVPTTENEEQAS